MSNKVHIFRRLLYRWSLVVLLPVVAIVLSACGTGGSGGPGY